jgi:hypothetical protein
VRRISSKYIPAGLPERARAEELGLGEFLGIYKQH